MEKHVRVYEQYCSVIGRNTIVERTVYHNGRESVRCLGSSDCLKSGGCKNRILAERILKPVEFEQDS